MTFVPLFVNASKLRTMCEDYFAFLIAHHWYSVSIFFVYRNDFMDLKQHVLLEYKENNLKMKKYFIKDVAIDWDVYIEGKQDTLSAG